MALRLRRDVKKASYYVWFLGAKESRGLRGAEYVIPIVEHLERRERDVEPFKVTLQVSHKGLKIVQNVIVPKNMGTNTITTASGMGGNTVSNTKPKNETIKHFIPHNTIAFVYQMHDVIACILLLFNPVTKCPLHVHAYRCDSIETATHLKNQLQTLVDRPENQKKFAEIEARLIQNRHDTTKRQTRHMTSSETNDYNNKMAGTSAKTITTPVAPNVGLLSSSAGSDAGLSTRESESSEERYEHTRITSLYDSVAAELREKLNRNKVPILLPPRDYDTVHRQKGNLTGIELRRCLNANIVGDGGANTTNNNGTKTIQHHSRRMESSGGSSGIGSASPDSPGDSRFNTPDNNSTSDEDWSGGLDTPDTPPYLTSSPPPQLTLPRPSGRDRLSPPIPKTRQKYVIGGASNQAIDATPRDRFRDARDKFQSMEKITQPKPAPRSSPPHLMHHHHHQRRHQSPNSPGAPSNDTKRRSMFDVMEDEHRRHSNEIAKEIKRRSYLDVYDFGQTSGELDRISGMRRNVKNSAGYRHSYAEPKQPKAPSMMHNNSSTNHLHDTHLHRTNSIQNGGGRVGIASVHPY